MLSLPNTITVFRILLVPFFALAFFWPGDDGRIAAFAIFWPLGLIALFLKLKKGELWRGSAESPAPWSRFKGGDLKRWTFCDDFARNSGNSAFDAYKAREVERLEAERRKLAEEQRAFGEFLDRLKKAKDQEEFDRFMSERRQPPASK